MDPANTRIGALLKQLDRTESISGRIAELKQANKAGKMDANKALQLADLYRQISQMNEFYRLTDSILANKKLPPQIHLQVADLYRRAKNPAKVVKALDQVAANLPTNTPAEAYLQIATFYGSVKHASGMHRMMQRYLQLKPNDWRAWLDYATVSFQLKQDQAGLQSLHTAVRHGGTQAQAVIRGNAFLKQRWDASRQSAPASPFLKYSN
jgi:tetratricopeptide (TPR) repeat protein